MFNEILVCIHIVQLGGHSGMGHLEYASSNPNSAKCFSIIYVTIVVLQKACKPVVQILSGQEDMPVKPFSL